MSFRSRSRLYSPLAIHIPTPLEYTYRVSWRANLTQLSKVYYTSHNTCKIIAPAGTRIQKKKKKKERKKGEEMGGKDAVISETLVEERACQISWLLCHTMGLRVIEHHVEGTFCLRPSSCLYID